MRKHFISCLNNERMEQFPSKVTKALPLVKKFKIKLFCTCKMPEVGSQENMAYCPSCHQWFHKTCEQIPDKIFKDKKEKFTCSKCTQQIV